MVKTDPLIFYFVLTIYKNTQNHVTMVIYIMCIKLMILNDVYAINNKCIVLLGSLQRNWASGNALRVSGGLSVKVFKNNL